jgi:hypothetical protein
MKTQISRRYFFQKLTQPSQGNNMLDVAPSNMEGFLYRDTCVSSTQLKSSIWSKHSLSPPETPMLQEIFLSNTNSILTGKICATGSSFLYGWFSLERYMCFFKPAE